MNIALCICTCNRPQGLRKALAAVEKLEVHGDLRVIVVDNHADRAGMDVCESLAPNYKFPLIWRHEAGPGISEARNASFREALAQSADFIAMIDDDEFPPPSWLALLLDEQKRTGADIVCGPIEPSYESTPPRWIESGNFFKLGPGIKSGNTLIRGEILRRYPQPWFDSKLGLIGGEDSKLFLGLIAAGNRFAPCEKAVVYETVPRERMSKSYILRRAIRVGNCDVILHRQKLMRNGQGNLLTALAKIGYALNHLFWSPFYPDRLLEAIQDIGVSFGIAVGLLGYRYQFYEERHGRRARFLRG